MRASEKLVRKHHLLIGLMLGLLLILLAQPTAAGLRIWDTERTPAPYHLELRFTPAFDAESVQAAPGDGFYLLQAVGEVQPDAIHTTITAHPALDCLADNACDMAIEPLFVETGDYLDGSLARALVAQFETSEAALEAMTTLQTASLDAGTFNYGDLSLSGPVQYFDAESADGWALFVWSQGEWVYAVSAQQRDLMETVIAYFPY